MTVAINLGALVLALGVLLMFFGRRWIAAALIFTAGALLAGSAAANLAKGVATGGATVIQGGSNAVSSHR